MQDRLSRRNLIAAGGALAAVAAVSPLVGPSRAFAQDSDATFSTRVRFLHADTSIDKIEIHINGDEKADEFQYGDLSDWIDLDPGSARITITADRAGFNYAIFDATYPVPAGNDYIVVITEVLVLASAVDRSEAPGDAARIQFIHASVDTPEVNVIGTGDNSKLASQLSYTQSSEYVNVPSGSLDVTVNAASTGETVLTQSITLNIATVNSVILIGTPGDEDHPLTFVTIEDDNIERTATPTS